MKRPEIIEAIRETLKRVAPNAQAILYGSEARGMPGMIVMLIYSF